MKREKKHPLILALQRAQIALHEAALEVGRLHDIEERIKNGLSKWRWDEKQEEVIITVNNDLTSLLPFKD